MQHLQIIVKGRVQGVYFRVYTQKTAKKLKIKGTVKNRTDGHVEIQAAGDEKNMQAFVQWCHKGPVLAKVSDISLHPLPESPPVYRFYNY